MFLPAMQKVMIGGIGNDTLLGNGGQGGGGDDILSVGDPDFFAFEGGRAMTSPVGSHRQSAELSGMSGHRIVHIEQIDLTGIASRLIVESLDVLNLSGHSNTLVVTGDATSSVQFDAEWVLVGTDSIDGEVFDVYEQGQAVLKSRNRLCPIRVWSVTLTPTASWIAMMSIFSSAKRTAAGS